MTALEAPLPSLTVAEEKSEAHDPWRDLESLCPNHSVHPLLEELKRAGVEIPTPGFELVQGGRVRGEAELAWESARVALTSQEHQVPFERLSGQSSSLKKSVKIPNHSSLNCGDPYDHKRAQTSCRCQ